MAGVHKACSATRLQGVGVQVAVQDEKRRGGNVGTKAHQRRRGERAFQHGGVGNRCGNLAVAVEDGRNGGGCCTAHPHDAASGHAGGGCMHVVAHVQSSVTYVSACHWERSVRPASSLPMAEMNRGAGRVRRARHSQMLRPTPPAVCVTVPGTEPPARTSPEVPGWAWMSRTMPPMTTGGADCRAATCCAVAKNGSPVEADESCARSTKARRS